MFILDTDRLGILQQRTSPQFERLQSRLSQYPPQEFFVSIVSFQEQVAGWNSYLGQSKSGAGVVRAYAMFEQILVDFARARLLSFDFNASQVFDQMRASRVRVATLDLRIASIALANNMTVLTRNLVDFRKIPGVKSEDWSA